MALSPGTRLGPYEILGSFGAGGQGEVYRARDTRLDRVVAIKSVKSDLGADAGHRARVEREARILAQLTHPNICALHDIVQEAGQTYLVMEALEGQTLAARLLARGKRGLPLPECLAIAAAAADGLAFAHQHGVVHQDVKPGNIMLTASGVKLLDFGIARLRRAGQDTDVTLTAPFGESSAEGTLPYMAPEQLRGEIDPRSDLFAVGAVLYEMLTGTRAFAADSPTALAARIVESDPPPLPTEIAPPAVARAVKRCLAKDPARRWQTATDLADELRWLANADSQQPAASRVSRRTVVLAATGAAGLVALAFWTTGRSAEISGTRAFAFRISPPSETSFMPYLGQFAVALSPNGRQLAFMASKSDGTDAIFLRDLDRLEARELEGTTGTGLPFWSPDGTQIAFSQGTDLKRIRVEDQVSEVIARGVVGEGSWGSTGTILIRNSDRFIRVNARDGTMADLEFKNTPPALLNKPVFLPDGEHFLFLQRGADRPGVYVRSLTDPTETLVIAADSDAIPSQDHLFFVRGRDLLAVPFDPRRRVTAGDPTTIQKGIARLGGYLSAFSVAANGTVAAVVGSPDSRRLAWFTLSGERVAVVPDSEGYRSPVISADGTRLTAERVDPRTGLSGVWVVDLERGIGSQISDAAAEHMNGTWSPNGKQLAFNKVSSNTAQVVDLPTQRVTTLNLPKLSGGVWGGVRDWTRDGRSLLLQRGSGRGDNDLWLVPLDGSTPKPLVATPALDADGQFSPDGRWLTYSSNESGRWETYLCPVEYRGTPIKISNNGGLEARWRRDGRMIFYVALDNTLMAVDVIDPALPTLGTPRPLFKLPIEPLSNARNHYEVGPDGKQVLVVEEVRTNDPLAIAVLTDWRRAATH